MINRVKNTITPGFTKENRSSFTYWFAHWCAFQMTALNLKKWKPKYLFHDWEKPWMRLFCSYSTVQKWHRYHRRHHPEYGLKNGWDKVDWDEMIIDWESCHYTKIAQPLNVIETLNSLYWDKPYFYIMQDNILPRVKKLIINN